MTRQPQQRPDTLLICSLNPWSVCNKADTIRDFIIDKCIDVLALSETWLTGSAADGPVLSALVPQGFDVIHKPRHSRGGGIAIIYRKNLSLTQVQDPPATPMPFEFMECIIRAPDAIRLCVVYRPDRRVPFLDGFNDYLSYAVTQPAHLIVVGDFNVHVDVSSDREAQALSDSLSSFGLLQHVAQPTHRSGHTLDLVIGNALNSIITSCDAQDCGFPDHFPVFMCVRAHRPADPKTVITYRKTRNITRDMLQASISSSSLSRDPVDDASLADMISTYQDGLKDIMNDLAPLKTLNVTIHPEAPWYNDTLRQAKQQRRRTERLWRKSNLTVHREMYMSARDNVNALLHSSRTEYYSNRVASCAGNSKELFRLLNTLLGRSQTLKLPSGDPATSALAFSDFFVLKIDRIRRSIPLTPAPLTLATPHLTSTLSAFAPISAETLSKLIASAPTKHCELDPIPTHLLKLVVSELSPLILRVINNSLQEGIFPDEFKTALVTPRLKKPSLDAECMNNYRPVSNLSFLSKTIERAVANQLTEHLRRNNLMDPFQSAYRSGHSTETALLRVQTDIRCAFGEKKVVLLAMIDLSAAFDTVDHEMLLKILASNGVSGSSLQWFRSYLTNRQQIVTVSGAQSEARWLTSGVPQGSVVGPLLFTIYVSSLGPLLRSLGVNYHLYADDVQIYISCDVADINIAVSRLEECLASVQIWMQQHHLKVNAEKTDFIVFASKEMNKHVGSLDLSLNFDGCVVSKSMCVQNIGFRMDQSLTCADQVKEICRIGYAQLKALSKIKNCIDRQSLEMLVHAFITSRIDFCNSLYYGVNECILRKLQVLQNSCARLITDAGRRQHITPLLKRLHWLPVSMRIMFKLCVVIYKFTIHSAPDYVSDLLSIHESVRPLRHSNDLQLNVPFTRDHSLFNRCFIYFAPRLWNQLPASVRTATSIETFKKHLKTHLFTHHFNAFYN